jgi:hypothetical protein
MLLRVAKIAGGLRLLIAQYAPLVLSSTALLSARTVAYIVGFTFGSILSTWLPIVATLITIAGIFNPASRQECEAYSAEVARISSLNRQLFQDALLACFSDNLCGSPNGPYDYFRPIPLPCTPPNCNGKKVWIQALWASPSEFASHSKGCFLVAYSYNATDGLKIEYNPFRLPEPFLKSRALPWQAVRGDRFKLLNDSEWKDFESVKGFDRAYWAAEHTDVECRGWRPGWSNKVK